MKRRYLFMIMLGAFLMTPNDASAQFLKKLGQAIKKSVEQSLGIENKSQTQYPGNIDNERSSYNSKKQTLSPEMKDLIKKAKNDGDAAYNVGLKYWRGDGVQEDEVEANKWYQKGAELGNSDAAFSLGYNYDLGRGVTQDKTEAIKWYKKGAELGNGAAACNLGIMFQKGEGVMKDLNEANKWYRKATELGYGAAACFLGINYEYGNGVTRDINEANKWYRKAVELGYSKAANYIVDPTKVLKEAYKAVDEYKNGDYHVRNSKTPYYLGYKQSEKFTENKDGSCTYFAWGAGLNVPYDFEQFDFSVPFQVEGMRNKPTGSSTLTVSNQGFVVKTYNDVQYTTDFYSGTGDMMKEGSAKKPNDPYIEGLDCRTGTHTYDFYFAIGDKRYKCKATATCNHSSKRLVVQRGSQRFNRKTNKYESYGYDSGGSSDFLSPWKFMHTLTLQVSFDNMAKAVGVTKQELLNMIIENGLTKAQTENYDFWIVPEFSNVLVYATAKILGKKP